MNYKIWNKTDILYTQGGKSYTPEQIFEIKPLSQTADFVICDAPINMGLFEEFNQFKLAYRKAGAKIQDTMSKQQVLDAITDFERNPPAPIPTAEERIAAAMEYDNLMKY